MNLSPPLQRVWAKALELRQEGRWEAASQAALALHRAAPGAVPPALLAAETLLRLDRYRTMREVILRAAQFAVTPDVLLPLVRWLRRLEESETLERVVLRSDWHSIESPEALAELALHAGTSGLYRLADEITAVGLARAPSHADFHYLLGMHRMFAGDTAGSVEALESALKLQPGMANAYLLLALQHAEGGRRHIGALQAALGRTTNPEHQAYLGYALHHFLHAVGDHHDAWGALARAHAACRRFATYDRAAQDAVFDALHRSQPRTQADQVATSPGDVGLIFIVGMFRSGTSLIERVLGGSPQVLDGGETMTFSACMRDATDHDALDVIDKVIVDRSKGADYARVRQRMQAYANWRANSHSVLTEKLPSNFFNLGFILRAFPEAKILHMRREAMDTCFSNLRTFFGGAVPYACDQSDLAHHYTRYRELMAHWHDVFPGRILDVDYSDFVRDPEAEARRLMAFCGLAYSPQVLALDRHGGTSASASAAEVRQGILVGRGGVWKNYAAELLTLREELGNYAT